MIKVESGDKSFYMECKTKTEAIEMVEFYLSRHKCEGERIIFSSQERDWDVWNVAAIYDSDGRRSLYVLMEVFT